MEKWLDKILNDDLNIGRAGEYLVCFDLAMHGYKAYLTSQGMPYDIILDVNGVLYKIQVKTTRKPVRVPQRINRIDKYLFHITRRGKNGRKTYQEKDVDIFALVALDEKTIGYFSPSKIRTTMAFAPENMNPPSNKTKQKIKNLFRAGHSLTEVANIVKKDKSYCIRVRENREDNNRSCDHLSDHKIEECL